MGFVFLNLSFLCNLLYMIVWAFFLYRLAAIVLSVLTVSDYPFVIFKFFLVKAHNKTRYLYLLKMVWPLHMS